MRITKTLTPGAILPNDREGPITLDGSQTLILTRNEHALFLGITGPLCIMNFNCLFPRGGSKIARFLNCLPAVWEFCK